MSNSILKINTRINHGRLMQPIENNTHSEKAFYGSGVEIVVSRIKMSQKDKRKALGHIRQCLSIFDIRFALINKMAQNGQIQEIRELLAEKLNTLMKSREDKG